MPRTPPCPYTHCCGGCSSQDKTAHEQLLHKQEALQRIFGKDVPVHPSPREFGYRSRMDFIISSDKIGLRAKGRSTDVVDIPSCLLLPEHANAALQQARQLIQSSALPAYDLATHKGFLRYLSVRQASSGKVMLIFTTTSPAASQEKAFTRLLHQLEGVATSILWFVDDDLADDVGGGALQLVIGDDHLFERVNGRSFLIGPRTFFQSNKDVAETMFARIRGRVQGSVLDLYCGVGTIALAVADKAEKVIGVEEFEESVVAAQRNARENGVFHAGFLAEPVSSFLARALREQQAFSTIIADPPRTGLGPHVARMLARSGAQTIIYMSCNPRTLRDDSQSFLPSYRLVSLEGYDMFPQTEHVECLAVFEKE